LQLLPPSLEELVSVNHPSRIVKKVIDEIDIHFLLDMFCKACRRTDKGGFAIL
jgi:hypothetical protein